MIGIIVQLAVSWLILYLIERSDLRALGLGITARHLALFVGALLIAAITCAMYYLLSSAAAGNPWRFAGAMTVERFLSGSWYVLKSVLFEEFVFRGVLLYLAIKRWGMKKACILSAVCFGVYHWISYNAFGNPVQMAFIFLLTGLAGLAFAYGFALSRSMYFPIGLHLGWNLVQILVFSNGPLGKQLLIRTNEARPDGWVSLLLFLFQLLVLPGIVFLCRRWLVRGAVVSHSIRPKQAL